LDQFAACFKDLEDPRSGNAALHDFHALLIIALCTVLCGGQGAVDMALFARAKEPFLASSPFRVGSNVQGSLPLSVSLFG